MKPLHICIILAISIVVGVVLSTLVTTIIWSSQIEPKIHCTDAMGWPFDNYWCDMKDHKNAGDTIASGWTWERLENARTFFITAFYCLWAICTAIITWIILSCFRRRDAQKLHCV